MVFPPFGLTDVYWVFVTWLTSMIFFEVLVNLAIFMECVLKLFTKDDAKEAESPGHFAATWFHTWWLDLFTCLV